MSQQIKILQATPTVINAIKNASMLKSNVNYDQRFSPDYNFQYKDQEEYEFPLKLNLSISGQFTYLKVQEGRIQIQTENNQRTYLEITELNKIRIDNVLTNNGNYFVILLIYYDFNSNENDKFKSLIYFCNENTTINNVLSTQGIFSIPLGKIKVQTLQIQGTNKQLYSIDKQFLIGNFNINHNFNPFSINAMPVNITSGALINSYQYSDLLFNVKAGRIGINETWINYNGQNISLTQDSFIYFEVNSSYNTATLKYSPQFPGFFNAGNIINIVIGKVAIQNNNGLTISQFVNNDIQLGGDSYKLKTNIDDAVPDFLSSKLLFQEFNSTYQTQLIGCKTQTSQAASGLNYKMKPQWLWKNIQSYNPGKKQCLYNNTGNLQWGDPTGSGSVSGEYKVAVNSSDDNPDYLINKVTGDGIINVSQYIQSGNLKVKFSIGSIQQTSGLLYIGGDGHLHVFPFGNGMLACKDGVMQWVQLQSCGE